MALELAIVSLDDAKSHLNMDLTVHDEDAELEGHIEATTAIVERHLGEVVAPRTVVEDHTVWRSQLFLRSLPVVSLTSITSVDGVTTYPLTGLTVDSVSGLVSGGSFTGSVRVTFQAGMTVVPAHIRLAALIIIAHLWATQRVQSLGAGQGFEAPAPVAGRGYLIPNQAAQLLGGRTPNSP